MQRQRFDLYLIILDARVNKVMHNLLNLKQ